MTEDLDFLVKTAVLVILTPFISVAVTIGILLLIASLQGTV